MAPTCIYAALPKRSTRMVAGTPGKPPQFMSCLSGSLETGKSRPFSF